jgi:hypothetical protein
LKGMLAENNVVGVFNCVVVMPARVHQWGDLCAHQSPPPLSPPPAAAAALGAARVAAPFKGEKWGWGMCGKHSAGVGLWQGPDTCVDFQLHLYTYGVSALKMRRRRLAAAGHSVHHRPYEPGALELLRALGEHAVMALGILSLLLLLLHGSGRDSMQ